jgi:hypothetical protein
MSSSFLPHDDLPPTETAISDWLLRQQLDRRLNQFFDEACSRAVSPQEKRSLQTLLSQYEWYITTQTSVPTLVIQCPSLGMGWRILKHLVQIGGLLESRAIAKIRIYSPTEAGVPLEVRVDELDIYRDSLNF